MKNNIDQMNKHLKCCGCRACEQVCPKQAIKMESNCEGFLEPVIDYKKCINCSLCIKKCPQYVDINERNENNPEVYAAKNKNIEELLKSASGGIFSIFARYILNSKGTVYGCEFDENMKATHIKINSENRLDSLRSSKYVQSDTKNTYKQVKEDLKNNKKVLYTGTPCQIAGLKSYIGEDNLNLYTIDLICHGVPSPLLFQKYIENIEKKHKKKITNFNFRNKDKQSWSMEKIYSYRIGNKTKRNSAFLNSYFKSFSEAVDYRECCYQCKYANHNRIGDITLGDYWGIEKEHKDFFDYKGVSVIIINTSKGYELFDKNKESMEYIKSTLEKAKKHNGNLVEPAKRKDIRNTVYIGIKEKEYKKIEEENLQFKKNIRDIIRKKIPMFIRKIRKNRKIRNGKC